MAVKLSSCLLIALASLDRASCFSQYHAPTLPLRQTSRASWGLGHRRFQAATSSQATGAAPTLNKVMPVFDFSINSTISKFERLDDAIMGGISTSSLQNVANKPYAQFSGVCRLDGGGFCGARTLPFKEPLPVPNNSLGFYLDCRLTSDNEPERRVWKLTTRSEASRGEVLYQATFQIPKNEGETEQPQWNRIFVPFADFRLVRGPQKIEGGAQLNVTGGLFQLGLAASTFLISSNMTKLDNFRPGYFCVEIREIGFYGENVEEAPKLEPPSLEVLSKRQIEQRRPIMLRVILPVAKLFFSEQSQRRKSALRLLQKLGLSRWQAILFGIRTKAKSFGIFPALSKTVSVLAVDIARTIALWSARISLLYPMKFWEDVKKSEESSSTVSIAHLKKESEPGPDSNPNE